MLGLVNTPGGGAPVEFQQLSEPEPAPTEALVAVRAFSLNRGELRSLRNAGPGLAAGPGCERSRTHSGGERHRTGGWCPRGRSPGRIRVGRARRRSGSSDRRTSGQRRVCRSRDAAHRGPHRVAYLRYGGPLLGRRVLITGAIGGVGHLVVQLAARSGARVTAVAGRPESVAELAALGVAETVRGIDKAQGRFALVLESVGGVSLEGALKRLEPRGTVVVFGNSSGEPSTLSFGDFGEAQNARLQTFFSFTAEPEDRFAPDLTLLVSLLADVSLKPQIGVERSWREIVPVLADLRERRVNGKAVLLVD